MINYNDIYYIMVNKYTEQTLYIKALKKSADRDYEFEKLTFGYEPMFFENSYKERSLKNGIKHPLTNVLLDGVIPVVDDSIRERLKFFDFKDMQFYPSVYIDDDGSFHENYWCMNFYGELDCWDRHKSKTETFSREEMKEPGYLENADIYKYHLASDVLGNIPEDERLIFKMKGGMMGYIFVHQKIADIFTEENATGMQLIKVSDFEEGMQF